MSSAPREEYDRRTERARELMEKHGMDAMIVTDHTSYFYYTGNQPADWMKMRPYIFVLPLEQEPAVITWSGPDTFSRLYDAPFPTWVQDRRMYPDLPFHRDETTDWGIRDILTERNLEDGTIGIEMGKFTNLGIPVKDLQRLQVELPGASFVDSGPVIWGCRMVKSEWEIDCSRTACEIGGEAWQTCFDQLEIGISQDEVKRIIQHEYLRGGGDIDSPEVMALGATGPEKTFQPGDVLYLDTGPSYNGYLMDYARRAVFGEPSTRQLEEHNTLWNVLFELMDEIEAGKRCDELFEYSQNLMSETKFSDQNYSDHSAKRIAHGIGLENEPPSMNGFDDTVLEDGMIITPEPKIESEDGLLNPEEHIVVREDGYEQLSLKPDWELHVVE